MKKLQTRSAELETRIQAEGCTTRHIAECIELTQAMIELYDEMLDHPPAIREMVSPADVAEKIAELM